MTTSGRPVQRSGRRQSLAVCLLRTLPCVYCFLPSAFCFLASALHARTFLQDCVQECTQSHVGSSMAQNLSENYPKIIQKSSCRLQVGTENITQKYYTQSHNNSPQQVNGSPEKICPWGCPEGTAVHWQGALRARGRSAGKSGGSYHYCHSADSLKGFGHSEAKACPWRPPLSCPPLARAP